MNHTVHENEVGTDMNHVFYSFSHMRSLVYRCHANDGIIHRMLILFCIENDAIHAKKKNVHPWK